MPLLLALIAVLLPAALHAQAFPQRFEHIYGVTEIPAPPQRVVSLGYVTHDDLLALGVVPLALRYWYGDYPGAVWPWAQPALQGAAPKVLRGEVAMEEVAALSPDLIIAISSGISAQEYALLSRIAPTVVAAPPYGAFDTPWDVMALTIGRAVGREAEAQAQVGAIRDRLAAIRADHPGWEGQTAVAAYYWQGVPGAYRTGDPRADMLQALGFAFPPAIPGGTSGSFYANLSAEDLSPLDAGVLLWILAVEDVESVRSVPLRRTLRAFREGREVVADPLLAGALSHGSLLSIPYALDRLVPEIAAAADGDPATPVPSAVAAGIAP